MDSQQNIQRLVANLWSDVTDDPGVYAIVSGVTGRIYIGSSANVRRRIAQHRRNLKAGTHSNKPMQWEWAAHGDQFRYGVLLYCHESECKENESRLIGQVLGPSCFNWSAVGPRVDGHKPARRPPSAGPSKRAKHVTASRRKAVDAGGRRLGLFLQPSSAKDLEHLFSIGYAPSRSAVISKAIMDAHADLLARRP